MNGIYLSIVYVLAVCLSHAVTADNLPGSTANTAQLQSELKHALINKGEDYLPRTRHLDEDGQPLYTNRLILEDSPYLLQHAHNPVSWHAWGTEPFKQAKKENKPVFLSIGYSTCHWCHVMERESFENIEIARYLDKHFIPIKVDRERRPDIDEIYMSALMLTKGQGGWPMSSFLTYDGKPFYSGTYYPPEEFTELLKLIKGTWESQQDELNLLASKIADAVKNSVQTRGKVAAIGTELVQDTVSRMLLRYDKQWGGFGNAPKFTNESSLMFLLQEAYRNINSETIAAAEHTLMMMAHGGVYDQIGGGFHRYSTDPYWLVPHFEKMLYHQAYMARVYLMAYQYTGNKFYARIAEQTLNYILRDMKSSSGGFYSASDAESDEEEGAYYVWTVNQIQDYLPGEDAVLAQSIFGITENGNFKGRNILHLPDKLSNLAKTLDIKEQDLTLRLDGIREKLLQERVKRTPPLIDKKILLAWNGMMITSLAMSAQILGRQDYLEAAIQTADFLWNHQRMEDGTLLRVNYDGRSSIIATQDDYANFAEGLIALYDADGKRLWLDRAREISKVMINKFWDTDSGGFLMSEDKATLFVAPKQISDSGIPSGNAVALHVLVSLSNRVRDWQYKKLATQLIQSFSTVVHEHPEIYPYFMVAIDELLNNAAGSSEYAAGGEIKLTVRNMDEKHAVNLGVDISDGWHINSYQPAQKNLIPLDIHIAGEHSQWQLARVLYPEPRLKKLSFEDEKLALYEDSVDIVLKLTPALGKESYADRRLDIKIRLQACNDEICLPPEDVVLEHLF